MVKTAIALFVGLCIAVPTVAAQGRSTPKAPAAKPEWSELSPRQQHVLAPLANEWSNLDNTRRRKWVEIANRYPKMKPAEQQRLQNRMQTWANLTPEQRRIARDKYESVRRLPPEQRREVRQKWLQYQQSLVPHPDPAPLPASAVDTPPADNPAGK